MTTIELTSGEILNIMEALATKAHVARLNEDKLLAGYYDNLAESFSPIHHKLQELPGEQRVARLVMTL